MVYDQHPWDDLLTEQDKAVINKAGYATFGAASWDSRAVGRRPALLSIDMQEFLVGPNAPILEAIETYRTAMGDNAWRTMGSILRLITAARNRRLPVVFTRVIPRGTTPADDTVQIVDEIVVEAGDKVIDKVRSSAFFETDLLPYLEQRGADTVIIAGNSTSGCVRATAVDARQHGLNPVIPLECVFDRIQASHKISLLDLWMKYAAVLPLSEVLQYIDSCKTGASAD